MDKGITQVYVFAGDDEAGYRYVLASRSCDMRPIAKEINAALQGRGGGKPEMVQGSVACERTKIELFLQM
jgi:alanyl-tRNA synthetase